MDNTEKSSRCKHKTGAGDTIAAPGQKSVSFSFSPDRNLPITNQNIKIHITRPTRRRKDDEI